MSDRLAGIGIGRVLEPPGALPQQAIRVDAADPVRDDELRIEVDALHVDGTSFRQIREAAGGSPVGIAERIRAIVAERGKLQNPVTGSGGVLVGTVSAVGDAVPSPPPLGTRVVSIASLSLTPLRLDAIGPVDPLDASIPCRGVAFLPYRAPWTALPAGVDEALALAALDVYGAASHVRALAPRGGRVLVLGGGKAGLLALAAARDAGAEGALLDVDAAACARAARLGLCARSAVADLRDVPAAVAAAEAAGIGPADLTVVVVTATGCEATAVLLTRLDGTIVFFSMATSFTAAALVSEGVGSEARLLVGSGYAPDRGAYALELLARDPALAAALTA